MLIVESSRTARIPPMDARTTELMEQLDTHRRGLRDAVLEVRAELRTRRPEPDRWSIAEVLEHLVAVERRVTHLLAGHLEAEQGREPNAAARPPRDTSSVVASMNAAALLDRRQRLDTRDALRPSGTLDAAQAWAALEEARVGLREIVIARDGLAAGDFRWQHPLIGPLDVDQTIAFVALHEARHTGQVREIAEALKDL
jgi:uncharacterized damage-inducible protein DinB